MLTVSGAAVNYLSGLLTTPPAIVRSLPSGNTATRLRNLGISYILITGYRQFERRQLGPWLLGSCREFRVEARFPPGGFILMPDPPRLPSEEACGPLRELVSSRGESRPEPESQ